MHFSPNIPTLQRSSIPKILLEFIEKLTILTTFTRRPGRKSGHGKEDKKVL
jgi:hypothetical protein